jgi:hypothetical protein
MYFSITLVKVKKVELRIILKCHSFLDGGVIII